MVKGPPRNEKLERLLSRKADLGNLRYRLWRDEEEDPEHGEALDRFLSELLSADEEVKSASKDIWHITKLDREERIRSLRQLRDDVSKMALNEFNERWMTRTASTVDYWLEVALDLEGVLYSFAHPVFDAEGPTLGSLLRPGVVVLVRSFTSLLYLAAGVVALYVAFGTSFRWVGWLLAAYFGWLIYRRAAKTDRLEEDVNRWRRNLTAIDACVQELVLGHFDASEIARRLRDEEKNGLFVRTTIFTILQRSAALHEAKDASEPSAAGHRKPTQEEMEDWAFQRSSDLSLAELRAMKAVRLSVSSKNPISTRAKRLPLTASSIDMTT